MKLGVVAEQDRASDSPDTVVIVEPTIGAVARSKGNLYLLVTSTVVVGEGPGGDPARRRDDPRRVLLRRVGRDPRLHREGDRLGEQAADHQRDRLGAARRRDENGPIGIGDRRRPRQRAVRRDDRPGRGLPDPPGPPVDAARPAPRARPPDRRPRAGRLARRDQRRRLARPRLAERHDPARRRRAQGRDGHAPPAVGDGAPPPPVPRGRRRRQRRARSRSRRPRSRRPIGRGRSSRSGRPSRWPGRPDRSPIPLADNVDRRASPPSRRGAARAKAAAGGVFAGLLRRFQDLLPRRRTAYRRVTPAVAQARDPAPGRGRDPRLRRRRRRSRPGFVYASAAQGDGGPARLGHGRPRRRSGRSGRISARCSRPGVDLVEGDPRKAMQLLTDAYQRASTRRQTANVPADDARPAPRAGRSAASTASSTSCRSAARRSLLVRRRKTPVDISVDGPRPGRRCRTSSTRRRSRSTGSTSGRRRPTASSGQKTKAAGATEGVPKLLATGRPRPADRRRQERPLALARRRTRRATARSGTVKVAGSRRLGRRRRRGRDVPARRQRGPLQPLRRRPVRAEHPRLHAGRDGERLPGQPPEPADASPATSRR